MNRRRCITGAGRRFDRKGMNAAAEVLLPIAAVAIGMTVLGLVFHIIASGAA
jgi:hypothetical protein